MHYDRVVPTQRKMEVSQNGIAWIGILTGHSGLQDRHQLHWLPLNAAPDMDPHQTDALINTEQ